MEEIYKTIVGFENYEISNYGNVISKLGRFKNNPIIIINIPII